MDKAVIFDMDGVLVDSMTAHWVSWEHVLNPIGIHPTREDFLATTGLTAPDTARVLTKGKLSGPELEEIIHRKEADFREILDRNFPVMPGAGELVRSLNRAGWGLAIGSSGPKKNLDLIAARIPGGELLTVRIGMEDVVKGKPEPEVFLKAAKGLGVAPARCVVIEDGTAGLNAAKAGGMRRVGLTGTHQRAELSPLADIVVDSLGELTPERLEQLL